MKVVSGPRAMQTVLSGMSALSKLVRTTYGPDGGHVAVSKDGKPLVTTDGASLVYTTRFQGVERIGAGLVRSAVRVSDDQVGDGTTTTVVLAGALVKSAWSLCSQGSDATEVARDIRRYLPAIESLVRDMSLPPDTPTLRRVAEMASHGDILVADSVVDAVIRVGENGTVLVQAGDSVGVDVEARDGLVLDVGWASHGMGKGDGGVREFEGPLVAVVLDPLTSFEDVRSLLEESSQWLADGRGLVLFCSSVTDTALTTLLLNDHKGVLPCVAVSYKHPLLTREWLEDIAAVTNAMVVSRDVGHDVRDFQTKWLGSARKVSVSKDTTTVLSYPEEGVQDRIGKRVQELLRSAEETSSDYDRDRYRERAGAMDGGLCILRVGGHTTYEAQDRRSRTEDTLRAVQCALTSGLVPGAGRALHFASTMPELQGTDGGKVLSRALREPSRVLCERAGKDLGSLTLPDDDPWMGFCPVRKSITNFREAPSVVDPVDVVLTSLRTAVSVACEAIKTGVVLTARNRSVNFPGPHRQGK